MFYDNNILLKCKQKPVEQSLYIFRVSHPVYIDAIHYSVRDNGVIRKVAAYVILGINTEGSALYHDEIVHVHF